MVLIILWTKSEKISIKIAGEANSKDINLSLNTENLLSTGIVILSLYLIVDTIPKLFSFTANYIVNKTRFTQDYIKNYTISQIVEILGIIIKISVSIMLIRHRNNIVNLLNKKKDRKNESNIV
jgi:glycerol-3-phosphate acyltransferase PlsY